MLLSGFGYEHWELDDGRANGSDPGPQDAEDEQIHCQAQEHAV
jgi:hypothetical protein